ncbi:hypothetical protein [Shimia marina]|uniref:Cadmium resistance transporter family protein n=1 Tax=Shimia marina TaxID=321267 RepID=A0A0P1FD11_9RHOB|nr:hypothetical protein [Shimia marina]CUH53093.1 cadmium resistance transporter family protein [Shimia marina]SFE43434.1 Cadmium resistance protein CadD, predicted permease [Shimia marina]
MIDWIGLAISATLAHVATNLDNLVILVGVILTIERLRAITGYLAAQCLVLSAAYVVAEGLEIGFASYVGFLGVIPMAVGGLALVRRQKSASLADVPTTEPAQRQMVAISLLFLSVSFDTFAVFTPLLADSRQAFTIPILAGAALSALMIAVCGAMLARLAPERARRMGRLEWFAPYVMIAVGFYIVLNTTTDAL